MKTLMLMIAIATGALAAQAVVLNTRLGTYYPTITQAVDAAASGDTLNISTGVYVETLWLTNKALALRGGYATNCTTHIAGAHSVMARSGGVRVRYVRPVVLDGLMITGVVNGIALDVRGGASVTCTYCRIMYNSGALLTRGGGLVVREGSHAVLINSQVKFNHAPARGGGVSVEDGSMLIVNRALIYGNTAAQGGGVYASNSSVLVNGVAAAIGEPGWAYNRATNGHGGGVYALRSQVMVSNNG